VCLKKDRHSVGQVIDTLKEIAGALNIHLEHDVVGQSSAPNHSQVGPSVQLAGISEEDVTTKPSFQEAIVKHGSKIWKHFQPLDFNIRQDILRDLNEDQRLGYLAALKVNQKLEHWHAAEDKAMQNAILACEEATYSKASYADYEFTNGGTRFTDHSSPYVTAVENLKAKYKKLPQSKNYARARFVLYATLKGLYDIGPNPSTQEDINKAKTCIAKAQV
jgi:hypothetical protein